MDGDYLKNGTKRSVSYQDSVGDTVTDSDWLKGTALETQTLLGAGGAPLEKKVGGPWTYTTTATETQPNSMPALVARIPATTASRDYQLQHDGTWKKSGTTTTDDSSGRTIRQDATGDGLTEVCTTTTYAQDTARNMLAFPDQVTAIAGPCGTAAGQTTTVSDTRTFYDGSTTLGTVTGPGDATTVDAVDSYRTTPPTYVVQKTAQFDNYGRVTSAADADQHTTTTVYSTPGASPDTVTVTDPAHWPSTTTLDPARGLTTAASDVNGEVISETFDGLGRATAVWSPLNSKAAGASPDKTFAYRLDGVNPPAVDTATLQFGGSHYSHDVQIEDATLRVVQDQVTTANGGSGERNLTDTHYNSLGQAVKTTKPYHDGTAAPGMGISVPRNDSVVPSETETFFDGDGRAVQSLFVADGVNQWTTTTAYRGTDATDVTPPAGGTATSQYTDLAGRVSATWKYNTPTPTGRAADAIATGYTYNPAGKKATVTDNAGNASIYTYDLHGRVIQTVDPDSGTSSSTYSPGGIVLSNTDGRGRQLSFDYDVLGRKTAEYDTSGQAAKSAADTLVTWTYDSPAKGQPTSSTRYTNGANDLAHAYTETVQGYTPDYKPTGTTVTIPSGEGALAGTYQSTYQYDPTTGTAAGQHFNPNHGLPKEQVNLTYTAGGLLDGFGGSYAYANQIAYSDTGQVLSSNFGLYGKQFSRVETYDPPTGRLLTVTDGVQTSGVALDTTAYTYNQAGAQTAQSTTQPALGATDTQCFGYDQQNRLTSAWTDTGGVTSSTNAQGVQVFGTGGCVNAAPVAGKVTGGPAPYWETFGYNSLGDRVTSTNHDTSVTGHAGDVTQNLAYNGYNAATGVSTTAAAPDAVQSVTTTAGGNTVSSTYRYNTGGGAITRAGQSIGYDAEGQTQSVGDSAGTTAQYTYAADGSLLVQRDPATASTTLYLPFGEQVTLNTGTGAITALRYYSESPDGVTLVRSSAGTLTYELGDTRSTATTTVDATTLAATVRYQDPFGNPRGTSPNGWPDQRGYLGKPTDPTTGLSLLGVRDYDPVTGRFLSVDPVLESGDPAQMGGYSYAADNPVGGSDPSGLVTTPSCPSGTYWNGNFCAQYNYSGPSSGSGVSGEPSCPSGTHWNGNFCAQDNSSGPGGGGGSVCATGKHWNGHACVSGSSGQDGGATDPNCNSGRHWNGHACVLDTVPMVTLVDEKSGTTINCDQTCIEDLQNMWLSLGQPPTSSHAGG
ncbi:RHS repeat domain-containing protein [Catenulispora yoronensis]